ncbi:hypothetical protein [Botrimarina mediterranea]|uniref:Uncharacterized protein n=1 Tax=Botrimarina mediterranea TaxID=2528022 RepID=A0A518K4M4_9BACT|nr:hypothetical protein [Botrimarina mediterranea]QDV72715.1 hypothetical protein Spa11_08970 [Botrimarina mediterranea]QDV77288.1 hypothetical protein K2D_08790 [Planctomycetes bacterium K2D]
MLRKRGLSLAATALGAVAMLFITAGDAQARRGFYRGPVRGYYTPYARGRAYYRPRAYRSGYRGYSRGYYGGRYGGYYGGRGGVVIGAPGVGVSIGW